MGSSTNFLAKMDIKNVTEFRNYVDAHGFRSLHKDIEATCICVMDYERGCNCWKANDRQKVYNNCKALYARAVGTITKLFAPQFLTYAQGHGITFYQDGIVIGSIRR